LAAGEVENPRPGFDLEQAHRARDDDVLVILAAALADQIVVPFGDVLPTRGRGSRSWSHCLMRALPHDLLAAPRGCRAPTRFKE
jgi:hypothetical protein